MAFLAMAFVLVALTGILATYTTPLPLLRAMQRETALDAALQAGHAPDPKAALEALRPRLGENADQVINGTGDIDQRVQKARQEMRGYFMAQAAAEARRMRFLVAIVTVAAIAFGIAMLGVARRGG
jgi:hypothetical protein